MRKVNLRLRFTLLFSLVFFVAVVSTWLIIAQNLREHGENEIRLQSRIMMEMLSSVRQYTTNHIYPLLGAELDTRDQFIPETVPAYSAQTVFNIFRTSEDYQNHLYREASLNPTNPNDLATSFEEDLISTFQENPDQSELSGFTLIDNKDVYYSARPLRVSSDSCLRCHGNVEDAPASLINSYGSEAGFGYKLGDIIAIRMLYVPAERVLAEQSRILILVMGVFSGVFIVVILLSNVVISRTVVAPVMHISRLAQLIYTNKLRLDAPEVSTIQKLAQRNDEFGDTARVLEQMTTEVYNREVRMIRESEERYRRTVAAMSEGLIVFDVHGKLQLCNPAAEKIIGISAAQFRSSDVHLDWNAFSESGTPFTVESHPVSVTMRTERAQNNVMMQIRSEAKPQRWVLVNTQPLRDPKDNVMYAIVTTIADVTERKQAEDILQSALEQERELGDLKSRFVSIASHEFRTPLAGILAATETLMKYRDRMDSTQIDSKLDRIRERVVHMEDIMNDVLQLARIQAGRVEFKPVHASLEEICREVIEEFSSRSEYKDRIECSFPATPLIADFDRNLMQRVLNNLVSNALKYSLQEQSIHFSLKREQDQAVIEVRDQGIGIPQDDLKHLFEPFHRASNVGVIPGTGLGLSIMKQAVELHSGTVTVDSEVDVGTTFTIRFPLSVIRIPMA
jgi:PAS domain S-box-containing protein